MMSPQRLRSSSRPANAGRERRSRSASESPQNFGSNSGGMGRGDAQRIDLGDDVPPRPVVADQQVDGLLKPGRLDRRPRLDAVPAWRRIEQARP